MGNFSYIKRNFKSIAKKLVIPRFYVKQKVDSIFSQEEWVPFEKTMLDKDFDLSTKDTSIDFTIYQQQGVTIDIAEDGDDYIPQQRNDQVILSFIREQYVNKDSETQRSMLSKQITSMLNFDSIKDPDIIKYVNRVLEKYNEDEIRSLVENLFNTVETVKYKIQTLLNEHRRKVFEIWLNVGKIQIKEGYRFPEKISMTGHKEMVGVARGLYTAEDDVNQFEYNMITAVAEIENVLFWHRNRDRTGFGINGFINHYPDFIVYLKSGRVIMVETKGGFLDGDDSKREFRLEP